MYMYGAESSGHGVNVISHRRRPKIAIWKTIEYEPVQYKALYSVPLFSPNQENFSIRVSLFIPIHRPS